MQRQQYINKPVQKLHHLLPDFILKTTLAAVGSLSVTIRQLPFKQPH